MQPAPEAPPAAKKQADKSYTMSQYSWEELGLRPDLIEALQEQNKLRPTAVQGFTLQRALDLTRKRFHLLLRAANGGGKTMAFMLPILHNVNPSIKCCEDKVVNGRVYKDQILIPQGIIIVNNNVLHQQLCLNLQEFIKFGEENNYPKLKFIVGELDKASHKAGHIIVVQAKSLCSRLQRNTVRLNECRFIAFDEADELFKGNEAELKFIFEKVETEPKVCTLVGSATMAPDFLAFYKSKVQDYVDVNEQAKQVSMTLEGVDNFYQTFDTLEQMNSWVFKDLFKNMYAGKKNVPQMFIFFNDFNGVDAFSSHFDLVVSDVTADEREYLYHVKKGSLSGRTKVQNEKGEFKEEQISIEQKKKMFLKFSNGEINIMLSTNMLARGIDVRCACFTVNYEPPLMRKGGNPKPIDTDTYLHRVGRTGRHNDRGVALTLLLKEREAQFVEAVKKAHNINVIKIENAKQIAEIVEKCIQYNVK